MEIAAAGVTGLTDVTKDAQRMTWRRTSRRSILWHKQDASLGDQGDEHRMEDGTIQAIHDAIEDCDG